MFLRNQATKNIYSNEYSKAPNNLEIVRKNLARYLRTSFKYR